LTSPIAFGASGYYEDTQSDSFISMTVQAGLKWARIEAMQAAPFVTISQAENDGKLVYSNFGNDPPSTVTAVVKQHPEIQAWGFINEPMLNGYTPATYTPLLQAFYKAVKAGNPNAKVSAFESSGIAANSWVQSCITTYGAKGYYDISSIHIYPGPGITDLSGTSSGLDAFQKMVGTDVIIGECNITGGSGNYFGTNPITDTDNLIHLFESKNYITGVLWYQIVGDQYSIYTGQSSSDLTAVGGEYLKLISEAGGSSNSIIGGTGKTVILKATATIG
jgi:hypothetical protein